MSKNHTILYYLWRPLTGSDIWNFAAVGVATALQFLQFTQERTPSEYCNYSPPALACCWLKKLCNFVNR